MHFFLLPPLYLLVSNNGLKIAVEINRSDFLYREKGVTEKRRVEM